VVKNKSTVYKLCDMILKDQMEGVEESFILVNCMWYQFDVND